MSPTSTAVFFGVVSALCWGASDYCVTVLSRRAGFFRIVLSVQLAGVLALTVLALTVVNVPSLTTGQWLYLIACGPLAVFTYVCFYRGLEVGPLAIVSPVVAAYGVATLLLAVIFLGDSLNTVLWIGVALTIGGVILASVELGQGLPNGKQRVGAGALWAFGAMMGFGVYLFLLGRISKDIGWFMPIYVSRVSAAAILLLVAVGRNEWPWQELKGKWLWFALLTGFVETAAYLAFNRGTELGLVSIVGAASSLYPLLPVAGSFILLKERINAAQAFGIAVVIGGLVVLSLG